jgi:hypothetical protein
VLPDGLAITDKTSVKLYKATYDETGTEITGAGSEIALKEITETTAKDEDRYSAFSVTKSRNTDKSGVNKSGTITTLKVYLPKDASTDSTAPYRLKFVTDITNSDTSFSNTAKLTGRTDAVSDTVNMSASADGSASRVPVFTLAKGDEYATSLHFAAVEGAHYKLYYLPDNQSELTADAMKNPDRKTGEDLGLKLSDEGWTGSDGLLSLTGVNGTHTYYVQELGEDGDAAASEGKYQLDHTIYGPYTLTNGKRVIYSRNVSGSNMGKGSTLAQAINGEGFFVDKRNNENSNTKLGSVSFSKIFQKSNDGIGISGKKSEFKLKIYPFWTGSKRDTSSPKLVKLAGVKKENSTELQAGSYTAEISSNTDAVSTIENAESDENGTGTLNIDKLEWGYYSLEETNPSNGYVASDKVMFLVNTDGSISKIDSKNFAETRLESDSKIDITNNQTDITVKLASGDTGDTLTEDKVSADNNYTITPITGSKFSDGTETPLNLTGKEILTGKKYVGKFVVGNSYKVEEKVKSPAKGYKSMTPVSFTIDNDGGVSASGSNQRVSKSTDTLTRNDTLTCLIYRNSFTFKKQDQNNVPVTGADITITPDSNGAFSDGTKEPVQLFRGTGTNGTDTAKNVLTGRLVAGNKYKITENSALNGFDSYAGKEFTIKVSDDGKEILIADDSTSTDSLPVSLSGSGTDTSKTVAVITNHRIMASQITFKKMASDQNGKVTDVAIGGVKFDLYKVEENKGVLIAKGLTTASTDDNKGVFLSKDSKIPLIINSILYTANEKKTLSVGLPVGSYYLQETNVISSYEQPTAQNVLKFDFNVTNDDDGKTIVVSNASSDNASVSEDKITYSDPILNKRIPARITVEKHDEFKSPLPGATIQLYTKGEDGKLNTVTDSTGADINAVTDSTGTAVFDNLPWGKTYIVKETKAPSGYYVDQKEYEVSIDKEAENTTLNDANSIYKSVTISDNKILTPFTFKKIDSKYGFGINGAMFDLYRTTAKDSDGNPTAGQLIATDLTTKTVTDANGNSYDGVFDSSKAVDIVNSGYKSTSSSNESQKLSLGLTPGDYYIQETGITYQHASKSGSKTETADTYNIDKNKKYGFTINIDGIGKESDVKPVQVGDNGVIKNDPVPATLTVLKTGDITSDKTATQYDQPLSGAAFELYARTGTEGKYIYTPVRKIKNQDGSISISIGDKADSKSAGDTAGSYKDIYTETTGTDGKCTFSDLPWGTTYVVKEIAAPNGFNLKSGYSDSFYVVKKAVRAAEIKEGTEKLASEINGTITVKDYEKNSWTLVKKGTKDRSVEGTTYTLTDLEKGTVVKTIKLSDTDKDGTSDPYLFNGEMIATPDINASDAYTYKLEETEAANGNTTDGNGPVYLRMSYEGRLYISYSLKNGDFTALTDSDNKLELSNALNEMTFYVKADVLEKSKKFTTQYVLQDSDRPVNYYSDIPNVTFGIYSDAACKKPYSDQKLVSDDDGRITVSGLENNRTYYLKQEKLPEYKDKKLVSDNIVYRFDIDKKGHVTNFNDGQNSGDTGLNKGQKSSVVNPGLEEDKSISPCLYYVTSDGEKKYLANNTVVDDIIRGKITLNKVDATDNSKLIPGSEYGLYREVSSESVRESYTADNQKGDGITGKIAKAAKYIFNMGTLVSKASDDDYVEYNGKKWVKIAQKATDENGQLSFDGVLTGVNYLIKELKAPDGSMVSANDVAFEMTVDNSDNAIVSSINKGTDKNGTDTVINVKNVLDKNGKSTSETSFTWLEPPTVARFTKVDENGKSLAGAYLHVEDENHNIVKDVNGNELRWKSVASDDGNDYLEIKGILAAGKTYYLVEDQAPAGYAISEPVKFMIDNKEVTSSEEAIDKSATIVTMTDSLISNAKDDKNPVEVKGSSAGTNIQYMLGQSASIRWTNKCGIAPKTGIPATCARMVTIILVLILAIAFWVLRKRK